MHFALPNQVTQINAQALKEQGRHHLQQTQQVDCSTLHDFDSSVLAVLLAWQRELSARNQSLELLNPPNQLKVLANVYGISDLLGLQ